MNKGKISITILNCVTALVCCIAIAVAGTTITDKIATNQKEIAELTGGSVADNSGAAEDVYSNGGDTSGDAVIGDDTVTDDVTAGDVTDETVAGDDTTAGDTSTGDVSTGETNKNDAPSTDKVITATSGLSSTNKAEVLKYYQLVMEKNEKAGKNHMRTMTLEKLDGGSGAVGTFISLFEPIAKAALSKNSSEQNGLPGVHNDIKVSDWKSAKAVNDGTYTTVTIQLVEQRDDPYGKTNVGTVGRSIGVLDGVAAALAQLDGLEADFKNGKLFLNYKNAYVKIKVNNKTGELVKGACEWHYDVHVDIQKLAVKYSFIELTLNGAYGIVNMTSSY